MRSGTALDLSHWPTKSQVASILGCSEKGVERHEKRGLLEGRLRSQERARPLKVYEPAGVDALRGKLAKPAAVLPAASPGGAMARNGAELSRPLFAALVNLAKRLEASATPREQLGAYVSATDATRIAGLSLATIRELTLSGAVKTMRFGAGMRYRRADLESL